MNRRGFFATLATGIAAFVAGRRADAVPFDVSKLTARRYGPSPIQQSWYRRYLTSTANTGSARIRYKSDGSVMRVRVIMGADRVITFNYDSAICSRGEWQRTAAARR